MPSIDEHLRQASENEALADDLERCGRFDWSHTVRFYAAVHLVSALLVKHRSYRRNHHDRELELNRLFGRTHQAFVSRYVDLYEKSRSARYECVGMSIPQLRALREEGYETLKEWALKQLQRSLPPPTAPRVCPCPRS